MFLLSLQPKGIVLFVDTKKQRTQASNAFKKCADLFIIFLLNQQQEQGTDCIISHDACHHSMMLTSMQGNTKKWNCDAQAKYEACSN